MLRAALKAAIGSKMLPGKYDSDFVTAFAKEAINELSKAKSVDELIKVLLFVRPATPCDSTKCSSEAYFKWSSFSCTSITRGKHACSLSYDNQLGEKTQIVFLFKNCETGKVIHHPLVKADEGTGTVQTEFACPPGELDAYCVSWQAYRESDTNLANPVAWSKSTEDQRCTCGGGPQHTGCIEGTVETTDGFPIPNIRVKVSGPVNRSDRTDPQGDYEITDLPLGGGYTVEIRTAPGYEIPSPRTDVIVRNGDCIIEDFELRYTGGGSSNSGCIRGQVTDMEGNPIGRATVKLSGPKTKSQKTSSNGNYRFEKLPVDGVYTVTVTKATDHEPSQPETGVTVIENGCTWVNFQLEESETAQPDLKVSKLNLDPKTACPGELVLVKLTVKNVGRKQAKQYFVSFYLSTSRDDTTSTPFATKEVYGGTLGRETSEVQAHITLPYAQALGSYYVVALVDSHGHVKESREDNNVSSSRLRVKSCTGSSSISFCATGPVDIVVEDPGSVVIDKDMLEPLGATHVMVDVYDNIAIKNSLESVGMVYTMLDLDDDDVLDVELVISDREVGTYKVTVVPRENAEPDDQYTIEVTSGGKTEELVDETGTIEDLPKDAFVYESTLEQLGWLQLLRGQNMISIGLSPIEALPGAVFDEIRDPLDLRNWDASSGTWRTAENGTLKAISPLEGYWIWVPEDVTIVVEGMPLTGDQTLTLEKAGWQQIGVPYMVAWGLGAGGSMTVEHAGVVKSLSDAVAAGWISGTISQWDSSSKQWIKPTVLDGLTLDPWTGYWIYTFVGNLTLHFSETPGLGVGTEPLTTAGKEPKADPPVPTSSPSESPTEPLSFRVINAPNPIQDTHTTTFKVLGICPCHVQGLRVEIYDLSGKLVWEGETLEQTLSWHTENELGQVLANGVYLYRAKVKVGSTWTLTPMGKLAILR